MTLTDGRKRLESSASTPQERVQPRGMPQRADARRRETETNMTAFADLGLSKDALRCRREAGIRPAHPRAGAVHPPGLGGPRPHRRRQHRHRQDRCVPAAHAEHAASRARPQPRSARAGGQPHPRACPADRPYGHADLPQDRPLRDHRVRRYALRSADQGDPRRHRCAHRHARTLERPHGSRRYRSGQRGSARAGRGRPHA